MELTPACMSGVSTVSSGRAAAESSRAEDEPGPASAKLRRRYVSSDAETRLASMAASRRSTECAIVPLKPNELTPPPQAALRDAA
eukprot:1839756-Prymnesium_polylepis.1